MKDALYFVQLALESMLGVAGIRLYEEPAYTVVAALAPQAEVRRYAPRLAAEVEVDVPEEAARDSDRAGRDEAFRLLFRYIAGANRAGEAPGKIAMTMPVETASAPERIAMTAPVETRSGAGRVRMRFFLPASFSRADAPVPQDARVRLVDVPAETLAVLRFSGGLDLREEARRQAELLEALASSGWRARGTPIAYYYDAPFTIPFLRRNEVAVPVEAR